MAIEILRSKDIEISDEELLASQIAILLHDVGHGPYSHALEHTIIRNVEHEWLSLYLMETLNEEFDGKLDLAIRIFRNDYERKFLHQLVSSQLDMDRMDYLKRDSYYTGVHEGVIAYDRIITMLSVVDDELVVEAKGIYSVEKFLIARRLMYWQVYLHKTVIVAEQMLVKILQRARSLIKRGFSLPSVGSLGYFLEKDLEQNDFRNNREVIDHFISLDDHDIFASMKLWQDCDDRVLAYLCHSLVNRRLFKIDLQEEPFGKEYLNNARKELAEQMEWTEEEIDYVFIADVTSNKAYDMSQAKVNLLYKDGSLMDIAEASDQLNISVLSDPVVKHYIIRPK